MPTVPTSKQKACRPTLDGLNAWRDYTWGVHATNVLSSSGFGHNWNLPSAPKMYLHAALPATRPKTTQSNKELPPKRLLPCTPPAISPAAYSPLMGFPSAVTTNELVSISRPPIQ